MDTYELRSIVGTIAQAMKEKNRLEAVKELYRCQWIPGDDYYEFLTQVAGYKKDKD